MTSRRWVGEIGLFKYAAMFSSRQRSTSSWRPADVSMMTVGAENSGCAAICVATSKPSMSGMWTSSTTRP